MAGSLTGERQPPERPGCVHIGGGRGRAAHHHLRRDEPLGAPALLVEIVGLRDEPAESEVREDRSTRGVEQDVAGAEVAVNDPEVMQTAKRPGEWHQDRDALPGSEVSARRDHLAERSPREQLEHQRRADALWCLGLGDLVEADQVVVDRMLKQGVLLHGPVLDRIAQDLDRDGDIIGEAPGTPHRRGSPFAQPASDPIAHDPRRGTPPLLLVHHLTVTGRLSDRSELSTMTQVTCAGYRRLMRFEHLGFAPDTVDYLRAWDLQKEVHARVVAREQEDTTLLLEHTAVYTAGKRTEAHERPFDGTPVIDVDRGGKITWHGPGQLVGYPIVHLGDPVDVVDYVRRLEEMMIRVARDVGVETTRVEGRSGIWVTADERGRDRKLGQIGIRVSRDVTMHGFALNANCDLSWAQSIVPCGIPDADVTTLSLEAGREITVAEVLPLAEQHLIEVLDPALKLAS